MKTNELHHLFWRAGFGINPELASKLERKSRKNVVDLLFQASATNTPLTVDTSELQQFYIDNRQNFKNVRQEFQKMNREKVNEFSEVWVDRIISSKELLRERMHLFWSNHFVCRDRSINHFQQYQNTMRTHALGNFGDYVLAVSKEASMLKYLNNKQNVKGKPNENFGRELLELFTLGIGNYSEQDIKAAAKAFTGWSHNPRGEFLFREGKHDNSQKSFLGEKGNFNGDEIIDIILTKKQCARFVCSKVYKYFVNENVNTAHVEELADVFYKDYEIEPMMRHLFMADWFYDQKNIGSKIKSPMDLYVGIQKTVPFKFNKGRSLMYFQRELGQVLIDPPNVAGWKGGRTWIDSNTMLVRLKLASMALNQAVIALDEKGDFEDSYEMYYERMKNRKRQLKVTPQWSSFDEAYKNVSAKDLKPFILQGTLSEGAKELISNLIIDNKHDYCVQLMSLPEYQMC